jgi:hypothetical protein
MVIGLFDGGRQVNAAVLVVAITKHATRTNRLEVSSLNIPMLLYNLLPVDGVTLTFYCALEVEKSTTSREEIWKEREEEDRANFQRPPWDQTGQSKDPNVRPAVRLSSLIRTKEVPFNGSVRLAGNFGCHRTCHPMNRMR